jgi:hypothetical protein
MPLRPSRAWISWVSMPFRPLKASYAGGRLDGLGGAMEGPSARGEPFTSWPGRWTSGSLT